MRVFWFWAGVSFITVGTVIGARSSILHDSQDIGPVAAGFVGGLTGGAAAIGVLGMGYLLYLAFDALYYFYQDLREEDRRDARRKRRVEKLEGDKEDYLRIKIYRPRR